MCQEFVDDKKPWWINKLSRNYRTDRNFLDGSGICRETIKKNSRKLRWIKDVLRSVEKSSPRVSIAGHLSRSYRAWWKTVFQRREKSINECNQASYSTKDPKNILSFQKHLSTKKTVKHLDPKHTHTLNKSNQFYISKKSWDSLVSIH